MNVRHHVSDDLLSAYATGELVEGWSLAVATHLALCPDCRNRLRDFEAIAGELFEGLPASTDDMGSSWAQLSQRLADPSDGIIPATRQGVVASASRAPVLPEPLRSYVGSDALALKWKPLGRGAYQVPIPTGDGVTSVRLLRIPAGRPVPEHSHGGRELTLVLAGSFSDEKGRFCRGDIEEADEELQHQPIAGAGEDCICLAVTDAPLRFKSRLLRLIQPVLGI